MIVDIEFDDEELLDDALWNALVKYRAGYQCERCECTQRLVAHHKDRDKTNNTLCNGECLCGSCHRAEHNKDNVGRQLSAEHRTALSVAAKNSPAVTEASRRNMKKAHAVRNHQ